MRPGKLIYVILISMIIGPLQAIAGPEHDQAREARGKYLVMIGGCNDCHTAGFAPSGGQVPEEQWLRGDSLGFRGAWGTTYPSNLREYFSQMTEEEWLDSAKHLRTRPPMPWWSVNALTEDDARAMYAYVISLGEAHGEVPDYVPPGVEPKTPYVQCPAPPPAE
jgi:mono/diheme cytochrome c family protein